jgi:hypothetical protein
MSIRYRIWTLGTLALALSAAFAQDNATPPAATVQDNGQQPAAPAPAYGQDNSVSPMSENPPISALDQPGLEPHAAPLSYLQPGADFTESADSDVGNLPGTSGLHSVTRALGRLTLEKLWQNYDLALEYLGGAAYYNTRGLGFKQVQEFNVNQKINWKRGSLSARDSFSYLPEGNFGGAYGSFNSTGQVLGGFGVNPVFNGGVIFGNLGNVPRIMNLSLVEVIENLSPKSAVTASGGYGLVHYTGGNASLDPIPFIGSAEVSGQVGYDRVLGRHDQAAVSYGYQGFSFSFPSITPGEHAGLSFHTHVLQLMWGHRISGRMDFIVGAGPQLTVLSESSPLGASSTDVRLTGAGQASLRYRFPKTNLHLSYERYTTSGSGIFPGANSDIGRVSVSRPLTRVWSFFADGGYAHNSRLQPGGGTTALTYAYEFAGLGVHRQLGREFRVFGSYEFNYLTFDHSFCSVPGAPCNRVSQRHVVTIGLDWTPRPIRLD